MPRKKIKITERETEDVMKRLFSKRVINKVKQIAHEKDKTKTSINKG